MRSLARIRISNAGKAIAFHSSSAFDMICLGCRDKGPASVLAVALSDGNVKTAPGANLGSGTGSTITSCFQTPEMGVAFGLIALGGPILEEVT